MAGIGFSDAGSNGHRWSESHPRRVNLASGDSAFQRHCARCGREFITVESSGECYAVFAAAVSFHQLGDEVTRRWTSEACPGARSGLDDTDRKKKLAELPVGKPSLS